jgi:mannose-6-phosphate isomerase-like protein (cupin superfamily)
VRQTAAAGIAAAEEIMAVVNLEAKLKMFSDHWSPKIVASFNEHDVMVVKVQGEFIWHSHRDTDDFFLVLKGKLTIQLKGGDVHLGPGDLYVVPKGVEHLTATQSGRVAVLKAAKCYGKLINHAGAWFISGSRAHCCPAGSAKGNYKPLIRPKSGAKRHGNPARSNVSRGIAASQRRSVTTGDREPVASVSLPRR